MAFNPKQFKQKKKRAVDPNAPPRPNLMSHDKVIREQRTTIEDLSERLRTQANEIDSLKSKFLGMQQSIDQLIGYLRRNK
jgi:predicted RNase H-like nuclease (RuvC/YqgF family)